MEYKHKIIGSKGIFVMILVLTCFFTNAQDLLTNGNFQLGLGGSTPECVYGPDATISANDDFDNDIANWESARWRFFDGTSWPGAWRYPTPDWCDNSCGGSGAHNIPLPMISGNKFIRIKESTEFTAYKEGIRSSFIDDYELIPGEEYTIRMNVAHNSDASVSGELRVHLSEEGWFWWEDDEHNVQWNAATFIVPGNMDSQGNIHWTQVSTTFTATESGCDNIIIIEHSGHFYIDDVEFYLEGSCPDNYYIQNTMYSTNNIPYIVSNSIYAGNYVGSSTALAGDVLLKDGANVEYDATNKIVLKKGFKVENASTESSNNIYFHAHRNGCLPSRSVNFNSDVLGEDKKELSCRIYPNPSNGIFNIELSNLENNAELTITNILGAEIKSIRIHTSTQIDLTDQPKGIYIFKVNAIGEVFTEKIIYK